MDPIVGQAAKLHGADLTVPEGSSSDLKEVASSYDKFSLEGLADVVISFYPTPGTQNSMSDTAARILKPGGAFYAITGELFTRNSIVNRLNSHNFTVVTQNQAAWPIIHGGSNPLRLKGFVSALNEFEPNLIAYDVYAVKR